MAQFHAFIPRLRAPLSCALLSYDGTAYLGLNLDPAVIGDPEVLRSCLLEGFDEVLALADRS